MTDEELDVIAKLLMKDAGGMNLDVAGVKAFQGSPGLKAYQALTDDEQRKVMDRVDRASVERARHVVQQGKDQIAQRYDGVEKQRRHGKRKKK